MQELEEIKSVFEWFMNLQFTFCDVEIKVVYLFVFSFFILIISLFFSKGE